MIRASFLTLRIHRAEILLAAGALVAAAVAAIAAWSLVASATPAAECWLEGTFECREQVRSFSGLQESVDLVTTPVAYLLPWLVGLLLGVPVVGKELETRTAGLAWSLSAERHRWLAARFVPMLALLLVGLSVVAWLARELSMAGHPWNAYFGPGRLPDLAVLGTEGPTPVAQGMAAFGVGLLAGALLGRTMGAFTIGVLISFGLAVGLGPGLQAVVSEQTAVWSPAESNDVRGSEFDLRDLSTGYREKGGDLLSYQEAIDLVAIRCPMCLGGYEDDWLDKNLDRWDRTVPMGAFGTFEAVHTGLGFGIGVLGILFTFPAVSRRRPE